jgi:hypothetical protein
MPNGAGKVRQHLGFMAGLGQGVLISKACLGEREGGRREGRRVTEALLLCHLSFQQGATQWGS